MFTVGRESDTRCCAMCNATCILLHCTVQYSRNYFVLNCTVLYCRNYFVRYGTWILHKMIECDVLAVCGRRTHLPSKNGNWLKIYHCGVCHHTTKSPKSFFQRSFEFWFWFQGFVRHKPILSFHPRAQ